jgi:uncharacterized damage-inducible protein DinB
MEITPHPLVYQLRFARSEFLRCLEGVSPEDAVKRVMPMNCISWTVGHLASQEHYLWVMWAQGQNLAPGLVDLVGYGKPASTPPLADMLDAWQLITSAADRYLETLTHDVLLTYLKRGDRTASENIGTWLQRNICHYWFHNGEMHAAREMLGHQNLPEFVGDFGKAGYGA